MFCFVLLFVLVLHLFLVNFCLICFQEDSSVYLMGLQFANLLYKSLIRIFYSQLNVFFFICVFA